MAELLATITLSAESLNELAAQIAARLAAQPATREWPEYMSAELAAEYLGWSSERVRKLQQRRKIPFFQEAPGHRVSFRRCDLDEFMERCRHAGGGA